MTEKIRVTIYVEKEVWGYVGKMAFRASTEELIKSKSSWVEDLIRADIGNGVTKANFEHKRVDPVRKESKVESGAETILETDKVVEEANARLMDIRKEKKVKEPEWGGGYAKTHQARKSGK